MFTATIRIDAPAKWNIGTVVFRKNRLRSIRKKLGRYCAELRIIITLLVKLLKIILNVQPFKPIGRVDCGSATDDFLL